MKMMMVAAEEPASGLRNSQVARANLFAALLALAVQPSLDLLDHDDGVVDDQADRRRHTAERHDVEAHAEHRQQQHGR